MKTLIKSKLFIAGLILLIAGAVLMVNSFTSSRGEKSITLLEKFLNDPEKGDRSFVAPSERESFEAESIEYIFDKVDIDFEGKLKILQGNIYEDTDGFYKAPVFYLYTPEDEEEIKFLDGKISMVKEDGTFYIDEDRYYWR